MKRNLIKTIKINKSNLEHIAKTGKINGLLLTEIERVITEYAYAQRQENDIKTWQHHIIMQNLKKIHKHNKKYEQELSSDNKRIKMKGYNKMKQLNSKDIQVLIEFLDIDPKIYCQCGDNREYTYYHGGTIYCEEWYNRQDNELMGCNKPILPDFANSHDAIYPVVVALCKTDDGRSQLSYQIHKVWISEPHRGWSLSAWYLDAPPDMIANACVAAIKEINDQQDIM